jgi:hypothetical protein
MSMASRWCLLASDTSSIKLMSSNFHILGMWDPLLEKSLSHQKIASPV